MEFSLTQNLSLLIYIAQLIVSTRFVLCCGSAAVSGITRLTYLHSVPFRFQHVPPPDLAQAGTGCNRSLQHCIGPTMPSKEKESMAVDSDDPSTSGSRRRPLGRKASDESAHICVQEDKRRALPHHEGSPAPPLMPRPPGAVSASASSTSSTLPTTTVLSVTSESLHACARALAADDAVPCRRLVLSKLS